MIESVQIATDRYAPDSLQSINMYTMDGGESLTLGQLMLAVCIRTGCNMEAQGVNKMNRMNANVELLKQASEYLGAIAANTVSDWASVKSFLTGTLGIAASSLPDNLYTYARRNQAVNATKAKVEAMTRQAQEDMIDLQSYVSKRDVCYTTGSNLVKSTGHSNMNIAQAL